MKNGQSHPYLKLLEKSECVVLPLLVMTVPTCPLLSVIREQLRSHYSLGYHGDNSNEQPHSFYHLSYYGSDSTWQGNGPSPLPVYENPEPLAGSRDPDLHLNIEESNKEFMAESKELYDSLMSCHCLTSPVSPTPTPNVKQVFTVPSS
ncbi:putative uncharacterized protein C6orf52 homolog [Chionomys nivalis]|uniref:putative uncharacterized protein C6orf52 homolog n=1 Tax=Chionomys nivalis TaxID=269649 RepID=UPI002598BB44|nr:putative uncharacterized protein C6orf52 homolog [Chionomys nivalis]